MLFLPCSLFLNAWVHSSSLKTSLGTPPASLNALKLLKILLLIFKRSLWTLNVGQVFQSFWTAKGDVSPAVTELKENRARRRKTCVEDAAQVQDFPPPSPKFQEFRDHLQTYSHNVIWHAFKDDCWWSTNLASDWGFPGFLSESNRNASVYLWQVSKCMYAHLEKPRAWRKQSFTVTLDVGRKMEKSLPTMWHNFAPVIQIKPQQTFCST